ncbi:hypothetical protein ACNKHP_09605 [Shigella boydii]
MVYMGKNSLENPRHIEFKSWLMAKAMKSILAERDCSINVATKKAVEAEPHRVLCWKFAVISVSAVLNACI